ncbi:hypothetical protein BV898_14580 [Hypsibius exemplaris]|uniref:Uncharacterized protein n=1 Tax=Hypsibius exemplaris TaxID=2072580 RepID=A0A9X6NIP9_HYPEX|nr:hypothetical protein BV898_14580 [Hypsibius exemplaris]
MQMTKPHREHSLQRRGTGTVVSVEDGSAHLSQADVVHQGDQRVAEMMDPTLLRDWVPYIYLVDKGEKEVGMPYADASWLLSIIGIANIVGRIGFGYLSDQPRVNRLWLYNIAVMIAGAAMCVMFSLRQRPETAAVRVVFWHFIGDRRVRGASVGRFDERIIGKLRHCLIAFGFMMAGSGLLAVPHTMREEYGERLHEQAEKKRGNDRAVLKDRCKWFIDGGVCSERRTFRTLQLLGKQDGKADWCFRRFRSTTGERLPRPAQLSRNLSGNSPLHPTDHDEKLLVLRVFFFAYAF